MSKHELPVVDPKKTTVQLRLGKELLTRIDAVAAEIGVSRNTWVSEAADRYLSNGRHRRYWTTAAELMADRIAVMVRLDPMAVALIDEAAGERGLTRTIWIMDACLAAIPKGW